MTPILPGLNIGANNDEGDFDPPTPTFGPSSGSSGGGNFVTNETATLNNDIQGAGDGEGNDFTIGDINPNSIAGPEAGEESDGGSLENVLDELKED